MITQRITKWGNSLGIRLPQSIVQQFGWKEGEQVAITAKDEQVILSLARPKYSLAELLDGAQPENQHAEVDWGNAQGEESW
ncbi:MULTISPECIES: AbrB/MazE/SpoVT family DNA-binding domain-containing protein [Synechocystis]|uniref:AbrB/MazE/SpoVT family DNA-binding domain-containing protein n=1 Tax=Synechocystis salina LEGE 00031 TaxID=1828736 RepID=A0ABR9VQK4_9SYNC|nr:MULTISPECIES: AbrB/MazE/SpoVT family DNA-binding domain-containing protein [Synechocystis]MBD2652731.1 AbrB/MazE/SpoVT family DNA-binding domain-containing protein [Synechocystis sp. FACHB-383]MBE9240397.1 AbrB/MazE/SpoVT family DNA-binding domain-containing protein [Synechocystis salina LEGE 00041]MBE9253630.1 AbrB/MazE/SpoVT family DNA-binding domain-containing protein [Synechocystis salina LEGE 00031]